MSYRKINDIGYKKIFPMSLHEDMTFCHYCGRSVSPNNGLEWDHIPALNVSIPYEYGLIHQLRKTLVRACTQCNSLASDTPHLDYIERHFWLKARYLKKYKSLLINYSPSFEHITDIQSKKNIDFIELINMLGFGVNDISNITSPILDVKNSYYNRTIGNLILESLTFPPMAIDEEDYDEKNTEEDKEIIDKEKDEFNSIPTNEFMVNFIASEAISNHLIKDAQSFHKWLFAHPSRSKSLGLELEKIKKFDFNWVYINEQVSKRLLETEQIHFDDESDLYVTDLEATLSFLNKEIQKMTTEEVINPIPEKSFRKFIKKVAFNKKLYDSFLENLKNNELSNYLVSDPVSYYKNFKWPYD
jgi:hypothetical protein